MRESSADQTDRREGGIDEEVGVPRRAVGAAGARSQKLGERARSRRPPETIRLPGDIQGPNRGRRRAGARMVRVINSPGPTSGPGTPVLEARTSAEAHGRVSAAAPVFLPAWSTAPGTRRGPGHSRTGPGTPHWALGTQTIFFSLFCGPGLCSVYSGGNQKVIEESASQVLVRARAGQVAEEPEVFGPPSGMGPLAVGLRAGRATVRVPYTTRGQAVRSLGV